MNTPSQILIGNWITAPSDYGTVSPLFLRQFSVEKPVKKATLKITSLGMYEAHLNGQRVGDFIFAPGWTSYQKRLQVQEYDVTSLIEEENDLTVMLGKGWYCGHLMDSHRRPPWNDRVAFIAELTVAFTDKTNLTVITDRDWKCAKGPVLDSEIYDGEIYDSNVIPSDWEDAALYSYPKTTLIPQEGESVQEIELVKPVSLIQTPKGETVIDFGQNMTGYVQFSVCGAKGHTVTIHHAEVLDADGNFYTANLRSAKQEIRFICNGSNMTYKPHFSFQGFRYIQLIDWPEEVDLSHFTGIVVHSAMERTGWLETSSPMLNQLYSNIIWGQKGNFLDVPTDCPQRDERCGWTGDAEVFARAATYNFNVNRFFTKWLHDLKAEQTEDGGVPAVIPHVFADHGVSSSSAWGDAAVICPWQLYLAYGNTDILKEQFASMENWITYIRNQGDCETIWNTGHHYGDWLGLDAKPGDYTGATDKGLIATAYFAYSTSLFVKIGKILGKDMSDYADLHRRIVTSFRETYMPNGKLISNTQTAHVLALYFDLCEDKETIAKELVQLIHDNGDKLTTGFVGTPYLLHVLSDHGYADVAYTLLLQEEFPSWLYSVKMGATTIWEHWDGMRPDGSMWSTDMNSFNHYAYGAVADWMYGVMAGIKPDEENPGYRHCYLRPITDKRLRYVTASLKTRYGTIMSGWRRENGKTVYEFVIPSNCTATVIIGDETHEVRAGKHIFKVDL